MKKAFWKTKRFWLMVVAAATAACTALVDDIQTRQTLLYIIGVLLTYMAGLFGVEIKRTGSGNE